MGMFSSFGLGQASFATVLLLFCRIDPALGGAETLFKFMGDSAPDFAVEPKAPKPANNNCALARSVVIGTTIAGTTAGARTNQILQCGTATVPTAPGVWYSVIGNGDHLVASVCSKDAGFETQISVFEGECNNWMSCIAGNRGDYCRSNEGSVDWSSTYGRQYFIHVYGNANGAVGEFDLQVKTAEVNDFCEGAISLSASTTGNVVAGRTGVHTVYGTTQHAFVDSHIPACGDASVATAPGLWYTIEGTGNILLVSTCDSQTNSNYDTQIAVFTGLCSESLSCVTGNDNDTQCGNGLRSTVSWKSEPGAQYYILVHGKGSSSGPFSLSVRESAMNDLCHNAMLVSPSRFGIPVMGTTKIAKSADINTSLSTQQSCGTASAPNAPGVWYKVAGTGELFEASTCGSLFDTQLSVFAGSSCTRMQCVDGNNDYHQCGEQSSVTWQSNENETYYILLHGNEAKSGVFLFTISAVLQ